MYMFPTNPRRIPRRINNGVECNQRSSLYPRYPKMPIESIMENPNPVYFRKVSTGFDFCGFELLFFLAIIYFNFLGLYTHLAGAIECCT